MTPAPSLCNGALQRWLAADTGRDLTVRRVGKADRGKWVVLLHTRREEHFKEGERHYSFVTKSFRAESLAHALELAAEWCGR